MAKSEAGRPVTPGLSHVRGPDTPPLRDETIGQALSAAAARWP